MMKRICLIISLLACLDLHSQTDLKLVIYNRSDEDIISWITDSNDCFDSQNEIIQNHFLKRYHDFCLLNCIYDVEFYEFSKNRCIEYLLVLIPKHSKFVYKIHSPKELTEGYMPRVVSFRRSTIEEYLKVELADRWLYPKKKIRINLDSNGAMTLTCPARGVY